MTQVSKLLDRICFQIKVETNWLFIVCKLNSNCNATFYCKRDNFSAHCVCVNFIEAALVVTVFKPIFIQLVKLVFNLFDASILALFLLTPSLPSFHPPHPGLSCLLGYPWFIVENICKITILDQLSICNWTKIYWLYFSRHMILDRHKLR